MEGGTRHGFFFQIKLSQCEVPINLSVDDETFGFGENFQKKFVVVEAGGDFFCDEIKFQVGANQFVVRGR